MVQRVSREWIGSADVTIGSSSKSMFSRSKALRQLANHHVQFSGEHDCMWNQVTTHAHQNKFTYLMSWNKVADQWQKDDDDVLRPRDYIRAGNLYSHIREPTNQWLLMLYSPQWWWSSLSCDQGVDMEGGTDWRNRLEKCLLKEQSPRWWNRGCT